MNVQIVELKFIAVNLEDFAHVKPVYFNIVRYAKYSIK